MSAKNNLRNFKKDLRTTFNIDFDRFPLIRLREETAKAYKNNDEIAAYKLDVASDIKELMSDYSLESPFIEDRQDFNFYIDSLLVFYFKE